jgi:hypothetical protein
MKRILSAVLLSLVVAIPAETSTRRRAVRTPCGWERRDPISGCVIGQRCDGTMFTYCPTYVKPPEERPHS